MTLEIDKYKVYDIYSIDYEITSRKNTKMFFNPES